MILQTGHNCRFHFIVCCWQETVELIYSCNPECTELPVGFNFNYILGKSGRFPKTQVLVPRKWEWNQNKKGELIVIFLHWSDLAWWEAAHAAKCCFQLCGCLGWVDWKAYLSTEMRRFLANGLKTVKWPIRSVEVSCVPSLLKIWRTYKQRT